MKQTHGLIPLSTTMIIPEREQSSLPKEKEIKSRVAVLQNYPAANQSLFTSKVQRQSNFVLLQHSIHLLFCNNQSKSLNLHTNLSALLLQQPICSHSATTYRQFRNSQTSYLKLNFFFFF
jgi:hypothetical protein